MPTWGAIMGTMLRFPHRQAAVAIAALVLASAAVMFVAFVVGVLPARLTHLDECQH